MRAGARRGREDVSFAPFCLFFFFFSTFIRRFFLLFFSFFFLLSLLNLPVSFSFLKTYKNPPKSLHSVHEGEKPFELELSWICDANGRKFERVPADKVAVAEAEAKAALAESDMDD